MSSKQQQPKTPANLWEQWLQRLSTQDSHESDYFRLELLELLVHTPHDTPRFFSRLATIMKKSLSRSDVVFVHTPGGTDPIYSNLSPTQEQKLLKLLTPRQLALPPDSGYEERRFRKPIHIPDNDKILTRMTVMCLSTIPRVVGIYILGSESLTPGDRKYLHYVETLLSFRRQLQKTSTQLTQEQKRLSVLTHQLGEGLATFENDMTVTSWNRPLQRLSGYTSKEAVGKSYKRVFRRIDQPDWLEELKIEFEQQPSRDIFVAEFEIETRHRQRRWVHVSGSFIRNYEGKIEQAIALIRDISHRKELEQRKNEFISIATHELRTPITAIKGYLSLLHKDTSHFTDKQKTYLQRANEASERLIRLAEELLQVVHVEENRLQFNMRPVSMKEIAEKAYRDLTEKAQKKGLKLTLIEPNFDTTVIGDLVRLEQVLANLVDNAIKYTPKGSVTLRFEKNTDKKSQQEMISVHVSDTGIGIDTREIAGIFEKFHRTMSATNTRESGAGLGLYIVKSFIEKQGGRITVNSSLKRGSTFTVTFPAIETKSNKTGGK